MAILKLPLRGQFMQTMKQVFKVMIAWSEGSVGGSERAKHVDLRVHFEHDACAAGQLKFFKLKSKHNSADILRLTKASISIFVFALWATNIPSVQLSGSGGARIGGAIPSDSQEV